MTKQTARSHTLHELCKALDASEAGVKNAMSRRKIEKCKDYVKKENGKWEHVPIGPEHHQKRRQRRKQRLSLKSTPSSVSRIQKLDAKSTWSAGPVLKTLN